MPGKPILQDNENDESIKQIDPVEWGETGRRMEGQAAPASTLSASVCMLVFLHVYTMTPAFSEFLSAAYSCDHHSHRLHRLNLGGAGCKMDVLPPG